MKQNKVYQHWDPLKTCIVGQAYPPEFYSWITHAPTRNKFEKMAEETEEDFQQLIKCLKKLNVEGLSIIKKWYVTKLKTRNLSHSSKLFFDYIIENGKNFLP